MLSGSALKRALAGLAPQSIKGAAFRSIDVQYHTQPLSQKGALMRSGRFHVKGVASAMYFGLDPTVVLAEVGALLYTDKGLVSAPTNPRTLFTIHYTLPRTLNLCDPFVQAALRTDVAELTAPWRLGTVEQPTPTQALGHEANLSKLQGIIYPSAKLPGKANLVVLIANLALEEPGKLRVHDESGHLAHTLP